MSITLKVLNAKTEIANYKVVNGETLIIKAQENVNYQLIEDATGLGPQNIIAKRIGDDLQLLLENGDNVPDVIIEDYYSDEGATNLIIGQHENGNIYAYVPESGQTSDAVSMLAEQMSAPQALGGNEISSFWVFSPWWLLAAGAVVAGVAIAASGGGSGDNEAAGDTTAPAAPTVTEVTNTDKDGDGKADSTTIKGKAEPGATVGIDTDGDGKADVTTKADENGDYALTVTPALEDGKTYPVTATDPSGNTSDPTNVTGDTTAPNAPTVTEVTNTDKDGDGKADSTTISGKAEPGSTVGIDTDGDGKADVTTKSDENGDYTLTVTPALEDGKTYPVTATDSSGNTSDPTQVIGSGSDVTAPAAPAATAEADGSVTVTPPADEDTKSVEVTFTKPDGTEATVTVNKKEDGSWELATPVAGVTLDTDSGKVTIAEDAVKDGSTVTAKANDGTQDSAEATAVAKDVTAPSAPAATAETDGSVTVTPPADEDTKSVEVTFTKPDGTEATVTVNKKDDGTWELDKPVEGVTLEADSGKVTIAEDAVKDGTEVKATASDADGNESNEVKVEAKDTNAPAAPSAVAEENGDVTVTPPADEDTKSVEVTFTKPDGTEATVTVNKKDDGTWELDKPVEGVTLEADSGKVTIAEEAVKDGTEVKATASDADGNESNEVKVEAKDTNAPAAPSAVAEENGDVTVTPPTDVDTKSVEVTFTKPDGTEATVTVNKKEDGSWELATPVAGVTLEADSGKVTIAEEAVKDGSTVTAKANDGTQDSAEATAVAKDVTAPSAPAATAETDGSVTVTPPADADTKSVEVTFTKPDGTEATVTVNKKDDGTWELDKPVEGVTLEADSGKVTIAEEAVKDGTEVKATASDADGNESNEVKVEAKDTNAPAAPSAVAEENGDVTVTPPTDVDTKSVEVTFTKPDGTEATVTVNKKEDGSWELATPVAGVTLEADSGKVTIAEEAVKDGSTVTAKANDGTQDSAEATAVAKDVTAPSAPAATAETDGSVTVTPPADADTKSVEVTFTKPDGTEATVTVNKKDDGTWELDKPVEGVTLEADSGKVTIAEDAVKDGTEVKATASDADGNESNEVKVEAKDTNAPAAPSAVAEENGDVTVTPPADEDTKSVEVTFTKPDGTEATVTVNKKDDGTWELDKPVEGVTLEADSGKVTIAEEAVKDGTEVKATASDADGNESNEVKVEAKDTNAPAAPSAVAEENGDVTVTPPTDVDTKSVEVTFTKPDGTEATVTVNKKEDGSWELATPVAGVTLEADSGKVTIAEEAVKDGTEVKATASDADGNESNEVKVEAKDTNAPAAPSAVAEENGDVTVTPPADADTKSVEVTFTDKDGTEQTVTVNKKEDGSWELATPVAGVTLDTDSGKVTIAEEAVKDGTEVKATASDADGNESNEVKVEAKDTNAPAAPSAVAEENGDVTVTPPADEDTKSVEVTFTKPDGTEATVTVNKKDDGTWELDKPVEGVTLEADSGKVTIAEDAVKDGTEVKATASDADGNESNEVKVEAKDTNAPAAPSAVAEENGDVTVTPPADEDTKSVEVTFTKPDGTEATVTVNKKDDGTWELDKPVEGVTLEADSGKVTIAEEAVKDGTEVKATASDADGNESNEVKVEAKDTNAPAAPSAVAEENGDVTVTPPTDVDTKSVEVTFTKPDGTEATVTVNKKEDGSWELATPVAGVTLEADSGKVTIAEEAVKDGSTVTAKANDGTQDSAEATAVAKDVTAPSAPAATAETDGSVTVTPPADADTKSVEVTFTKPDGTEATVTVNKKDDGTWELDKPVEGVTLEADSGKVTIAEDAVKDGTEVKATASDADGNESNEVKVEAKDTNAPAAPSAVAEENGDVTVTPPADEDTKSVEVTFTKPDGTEATVTVNKKDDGTWELDKPVEGVTLEADSGKVTIAEEAVKDGTEVKATASDADGNESNEVKVEAKDTNAPAAPSAVAEENGDVTVTPPTDVDTKSVEVTFTKPDGTEATVTVNKKEDGSWELATPVAGVTLEADSGKVTIAEEAVKDGTEVKATASDADGNESNEVKVEAKDTNAPAAPSAVAEENGDVTVTPPADADTKSVEVTFTDKDGTEQTVTVNKKEDGSWELATPVAGVTLDTDSGKVTIAEEAVKDGTEVKATASDADGNESNEVKVEAKDTNAPAAPSAVAEENGDVTVTPPADEDTKSVEVTFTKPDGTEATVTVNKKDDGTWELDKPVEGVTLEADSGKVTIAEDAVKDGTEVKATASDADGNESNEVKVEAKDTNAPAAPSAVAEENGDVTVTPPADEDTKSVEVTFTKPDGTEATVTVNKKDDGTWELDKPVEGVTLEADSGKVTIAEEAVKDGTEVKATASDADGNESNEVKVEAKDTNAPAAPSAVAEENGDVTVTPPTDVDTKSVEVTFTKPDGTEATVTVNKKEDGSWELATPVAGVTLEADSGKVTIAEEAVKDGSTVTAKANDGTQDSAEATAVAKDVTAPSAPAATAETDGSVTVTPPADADTKSVEVTFTKPDGTEATVTVNKKDDGTWELDKPVEGVTLEADSGKVTIAEEAVKDGTEVKATASDADGNESNEVKVEAKDTNAPAAPSAVAEENGDVTVTPPTDVDTKSVEVTFTKPDGTEATVTVNKKEDGSWELATPVAGVTLEADSGKVTIAEEAVKDGSTVTAKANDGTQDSAEATAVAKDVTAPSAPAATAETDGSVTVTPPADEDTKSVEVTFTKPDGTEATVTVNKKDDGTWELDKPVEGVTLEADSGKVTIAEDAVKDGTEVKATASDADGNESNEVKVEAKDTNAPAAPSAVAEENGDVTVTPPADEDTKSVEVTFTKPDGTEQTVTVNKKEDGSWELATPVAGVTLDTDSGKVTIAEEAVKDGTEVKATASDADGNESNEVKVEAKDTNAPAAPSAVAEENGDVTVTPPADADTKSVEVTFTDKDGTEQTVTVNKKEDGSWELATPVAGVTLDTDSGKVTIAEEAVKDGTEVKATASDADGNESNEVKVEAKDTNAPAAPSAVAEENGDVTVTPPADEDTKSVEVTFTKPDGTEATVTVNKKDDGTWELDKPVEGVTLEADSGKVTIAEDAVKDGTEVKATASDADGNESNEVKVEAKDTNAPAAPSAVAEENGDVTVTPPADEDTKSVEVTFTKPDGTEQTVTVNKKEDGSWELATPVAGVTLDTDSGKVTIAEEAVKDGTEVKATASDADGNESNEVKVEAKDTNAPAAPSAVAEENGDVTVTPPADADTKSVEVTFTDKDGTEQTVTVNKKEDGSWELATPVAGVTLDTDSGKVTIAEEAVKDGTEVKATASDADGNESNEVKVEAKDTNAPAAPSAVAEENGDVTVTPPADEDTKSVEVTFTKPDGTEATVTVNKKDDGTWELDKPVEGVTLEADSGKVTIAEDAVKDGTEVKATASDADGNESNEVKVEAKDTNAPAAPSAVAEENGDVTVTPPTDVDTKSVEVTFTKPDGTEATVTVNKKEDGSWELATPVAGVTLEADSGKVTIAEEAVKDGSTVTAKANDGTQDSAEATAVAKDVTAPSAPAATAETDGSVTVTPPADADTKSVEVTFTKPDGTEATVTVNKKDDGTWELDKPVEGVTLEADSGKVTIAEEAVKDGTEVKATASDADGNESNEVKVEAKDTNAPAAPSAVAEENGDVTVTPPTDVDTKSVEVTFTKPDGTEATVTVNKKEDGSWELATPVAGVTLEADSGKVTIAEEAVKDGSTVTAKANDGTQDSAEATAVAKDVTAPSAPAATAETDGSVTVTPPADADTKSVEVTFTKPDGTEATVTVNKKDDGTWELDKPVEGVTLEADSGKVTIAEDAVKDGTEVKATASDADGNESNEVKVEAKDTNAPAAPSAVAEENGDVTVTPPADADTKSVEVTFTDKDGTEQTVTVNKKEDGSWELATPVAGVTLDTDSGKVTIAEEAVKDGTEVKATASDADGNESNEVKVEAKDTNAPAAPSAVAEENGDVTVTPPADADTKSVEVTFTDKDGTEQTVTVNKKEDGSWELATPVAGVTLDTDSGKVTIAEEAVKDGTEVKATASDADGNESNEVKVEAKDTNAPAAPSAVAEENGDVTVTPPADEDTKSVEVTFTKPDGTEATVTVNKKDDGTWELDKPVEGVTLEADSGKVTIAEEAVKDGTEVKATASDADGNESNEVKVEAKDTNAPAAPSAVAEENGDVTVTPPTDVDTKSVEVTFTKPDGTEATVTVNKKEDGSWELATPVAGVTLEADSGKVTIAEEAVKDGSTVTAKANDGTQDSAEATAVAKDVTAPSAPAATAETDGSVTVTPPADADTKSVEVTFTKPDGTEATVTVNKKDDGTWELDKPVEGVTLEADSGKVTIAEEAVKDGSTVSAIAKDGSNNLSEQGEVEAPIILLPAQPIVTLVRDTGFSSADKITNNGGINVSNLEEGTTREYSIDGGNTWIVIPGITGNTVTFELVEGKYPSILVRQNKDGRSSVAGSLNDVSIDKTPPVIPELKLAQISDSGYSDTDNITNIKQPTLEGVTEPGTMVRIYVDGSYYADRANDTGKFSIKITKDMSEGQKFPHVMAVDAAGNTSTATPADPTKWTAGKPFIVNLSAEQPIISQDGYGTVTVETNDQQAYKLTTFYFDTEGNKQTAVATKGTDGNWIFTFSGSQPAGTFDSKTGKMTFAEGVIQSGSTVEAKLEDNAGNIADASRKLLFNPEFAERIVSIEYFENSLISDVLGKVTATDKDNQVVQYRFLNDDGTETNISKDGRYLISSSGEFALTENGGGLTSTLANISTKDSNNFETAPNKFGPYKVIAIDQTGLKSKPIDVDFTVQNVLAIRTLWVDLNDKNGANGEGAIASTDTTNKNFQFTSEKSDKVLIGYNEAGKAETGLGIGNIERGAVLKTLDGDDYVKLSQSVGSNNMDGGIALGNGNNTLLVGNDIIGGTTRSWVTSGDGNDTILVGDFSSIANDRDDIQNATILTGAGNDTLRLQGGDVKANSIIDMGSGNDSIIITDNGTALRADQSLDTKATYTGRDVGGHIYDSTIILGAGDDTLTTYNYLQDATIIGDAANTPIALDSSPYTPIGTPRDVKDSGISSLTGDDTVILGVNADGSRNGKGIMYYSSKIDLGGGNDTLIVDQIRDNSKVYMGDGNDSVTITKTFGRGDGSALVDMGAGNDTLTWSGNAGMGYNDLGSISSKMLGGTGVDKLIVDSNVPSGGNVISHISTVNFTGFEQIQLKNQAVLDIRYGDLFNDTTREGNFYVMGGSTNKVDLGQSNWNNDGVDKISLVDNGAAGNGYYNGSWVKQSSTTVEGITYDIYRHSEANGSDNDVYIQQGIIVI
ncbi:Ig-like domain-containing protein [Pasteurella testudinis]|uniref:Ig-like domain-containing protein n=1 Tax=Pasteurella testudinis TaxID=761 RepID=UPI004058B712